MGSNYMDYKDFSHRFTKNDDEPASFTLARNDAGSAGLYHLEEQQLWCGRPSYRLTSGRSRAIHHDGR
jgi:hypothetical protein